MGTLRISVADVDVSWPDARSLKYRGWHAPAPLGDPPAPPDYSTPARVTARCRERGSKSDADVLAASRDTGFKRALKAFRVACPMLLAYPVQDRHKPRHSLAWYVRERERAEKEARP